MTVKSRLLELLEQHKGETLSGELLAGELSCTRAAIWKAVQSLREMGYHIEAGPNRGYVLAQDTDRLSAEGIRLYLDNPQTNIEIFEEVDSTNQTAKEIAVAGKAGHGALVLARGQQAGRGRRGRSFFSPKDAGLYLSVIIKPESTLTASLLLTSAAAVAVCRAVQQVYGLELSIKWVNDLYYQEKKVCGILTEAVTDFESGNIEFAVIGIGLNLFQGQEPLPLELREKAGVLFPEYREGENLQRNRLAAEIVNQILTEVSDLKLSPEYVKRNIIPGKFVTILDGNSSRRVFAERICEDGRLLVREADGRHRRLAYGEITDFKE